MSEGPHVYRGSEVIVTFDSNVCIHAGHCVRELPGVFNLKAKPWVQPDKGARDEIVSQVSRCPSGALQIVDGDDE